MKMLSFTIQKFSSSFGELLSELYLRIEGKVSGSGLNRCWFVYPMLMSKYRTPNTSCVHTSRLCTKPKRLRMMLFVWERLLE